MIKDCSILLVRSEFEMNHDDVVVVLWLFQVSCHLLLSIFYFHEVSVGESVQVDALVEDIELMCNNRTIKPLPLSSA